MINSFDVRTAAQTPSTLLVNVFYRGSRHLWAAEPLNDAVSELGDFSGNMVLILDKGERLILLVKEHRLVFFSLFRLLMHQRIFLLFWLMYLRLFYYKVLQMLLGIILIGWLYIRLYKLEPLVWRDLGPWCVRFDDIINGQHWSLLSQQLTSPFLILVILHRHSCSISLHPLTIAIAFLVKRDRWRHIVI